jgi:hypothetical protein
MYMELRKCWHMFPMLIEYYLLIQTFDMIQTAYYLKYLAFFVVGSDCLRLYNPNINNLFVKSKFLKKDEYDSISASTYYFISIYVNILLGAIYPSAMLYYFIGMVSLAVGDPTAYFIGTTFPLIRLYNGKTLSGTLGCVASCILFNYITIYICMIYRNDLLVYYNLLTTAEYFAVACLGAFVSAITELVSGKYDNLTIAPLTAVSMHIGTNAILYYKTI